MTVGGDAGANGGGGGFAAYLGGGDGLRSGGRHGQLSAAVRMEENRAVSTRYASCPTRVGKSTRSRAPDSRDANSTSCSRGTIESPSAATSVVGVVMRDGSTRCRSVEIDRARNRSGRIVSTKRAPRSRR